MARQLGHPRQTRPPMFCRVCIPHRRTHTTCKDPAVPPREPAVFECSCGEKTNGRRSGKCPYQNRCREPLAWSIDPNAVQGQTQSPLFTKLPNEIRLLIWEFALTSSISDLKGARLPADHVRREGCVFVCSPSDVTFALLQTCRQVYLETYTLPMRCNPYYMPQIYQSCRAARFLAYQYASLERLEISVIQAQLEGHELSKLLFAHRGWNLKMRNSGALIAPRSRNPGAFSRDFIHVPITEREYRPQRFWDALQQNLYLLESENIVTTTESSTLRIILARPITHLTLRLDAESWWTWTDDPESIHGNQQLALDPTQGDGTDNPDKRPTQHRMRELAAQRRSGRFDKTPASDSSTWGTVVGSIPGIKSLELVLETFAEKKLQLDTVLECAKTWKFPIADSQQVLTWDGSVEVKKWEKEITASASNSPIWYRRCTQFEVRVLRFVRRHDR